MAAHIPYILYDNILNEGTLTASSEATDKPVSQCVNFLNWNYWEASAAGAAYVQVDAGAGQTLTADCVAVCFGQNVGADSGTILIQHSSDASTWTTLVNESMPERNYFKTFTSASDRYWRVTFTTSTVAVKIPVICLGVKLELQGLRAGFMPPNLATPFKSYTTESETGNILGRSIQREPIQFNIAIDALSEAWIRNYWLPFLNHAAQKAFFFAWSYDANPTESVFCRVPDDRLDKPAFSNRVHMSINLACLGEY